MISILELQKLLVNKEFNPYINIDLPSSVFIHLIEEIGETAKAYRSDKSKSDYMVNLEDELGDCMILLCFFAESVNINLEKATFFKIMKNIKRNKFQPNNNILDNLKSLFDNGE